MPEDTEIAYCWFCREWHGTEKFCPTTCLRWLKVYRRRIGAKAQAVLDCSAMWLVYVLLLLTVLVVVLNFTDWLLGLAREYSY